MRRIKKEQTKKPAPILPCILTTAAAALWISGCSPQGCRDYTVQMKQHYVEYSDKYDYWDVLTVEYPQLTDTGAEWEDAANEQLYDTAMNRVNYWHLSPNEDVLAFQKENFSIFCSDVDCSIPFHNRYLLSADYREFYSAGNPVWYTSRTERALNLDLVTGEIYELADIINIDEAFVQKWCEAARVKYGDTFEGTAEETALFLSWFLNENEQTKQLYELHNFFYPTGHGSFIIGFAYDPRPAAVNAYATGAQDNVYCVELSDDTLKPFQTDSLFWNRYNGPEDEAQIRECEDKQENLWLGKEAGVWDYWDEHR